MEFINMPVEQQLFKNLSCHRDRAVLCVIEYFAKSLESLSTVSYSLSIVTGSVFYYF